MPSATLTDGPVATPGNGYLEVLTSPKTTVYTSQPGQITARGFIDPSGVEHEVDVSSVLSEQDTELTGRRLSFAPLDLTRPSTSSSRYLLTAKTSALPGRVLALFPLTSAWATLMSRTT